MPTTPPTPLYHPTADRGAYQLRYSWTAWPSQEPFPTCPTQLLTDIAPLWETDGLRILEYRWLPDKLQILFSTLPHVSPSVVAARAKGRLHFALKKAGLKLPLSRKVSARPPATARAATWKRTWKARSLPRTSSMSGSSSC